MVYTHLKIPVVQHEHAIIIDNRTVFGDVIYNRVQGYRQERIKVKGYRSDEWNGSYNIPGFIFDDAKVTEWTSWQDYAIGSSVLIQTILLCSPNIILLVQNYLKIKVGLD